MSASLATVAAITKEVYGPRIVDQLEHEITLTKRMEKTSEGTTSEVGGKYVTFPLKTRRNTGIGYRNENEQLQAPGRQGWASVRVPLRYGYGRVRLTGQAIDLVDKDYQAFASAINEEMNGLKDDLKKDTNRILWGNGVGVLAVVDTAATSGATVISVGIDADSVKWLDMDMRVDILSSNGSTVRASNVLISYIDEETGDFTLSAGVANAVSVGDVVVRTGNYGREPKGMQALVTDTTAPLFNLSKSDEPLWQSKVYSNTGALSESKMIATCDHLRTKGGAPSVIFADLASRRAYFNLLKTDRRFTDTKTFDGGFKGLAFNYEDEIPVVTDVDAPAGNMWFLREKDFKVYQSKDWHWEDRDGSLWKWVDDYDAFQALMKKYWEFALNRRNTHARMSGITPG